MPTDKEAIKEALLQLDQKNDKLWTDDGSPVVTEVQRLCNDSTLSRADINDAFPGFARKSTGIDEKTQAPVEIIKAEAPPAPPDEDDFLSEVAETGTKDELRLVSTRHVQDAELALIDAKTKVTEAQRHVFNCERILAKKIQLHNSKFPPISAAQNIKDHLDRVQANLYERVTGKQFVAEPVVLNPVDVTMQDRKRANGRNAQSRITPAPYLPRKAALSY